MLSTPRNILCQVNLITKCNIINDERYSPMSTCYLPNNLYHSPSEVQTCHFIYLKYCFHWNHLEVKFKKSIKWNNILRVFYDKYQNLAWFMKWQNWPSVVCDFTQSILDKNRSMEYCLDSQINDIISQYTMNINKILQSSDILATIQIEAIYWSNFRHVLQQKWFLSHF